MELIDVTKTRKGHARLTIKIGGAIKKYEFSHSTGDIFVAHFPDDLKRLLRLLPVAVAQSVVANVENCLTTKTVRLPFEIEIEKEILQMV
jgi:hypothetical protein